MGYIIQRVGSALDVKQKVPDVPETVQHTIVGGTAKELLAEDETATIGQKIIITNNLSAELLIAYGRTATATNYDIPISPGSTWIDDNFGADAISGISTASGTNLVTVTVQKYTEV